MHLEKIEISGFKSFADKTVLRFDQPITAIVGPNGCGKSNIVDAFRWVLGEGSAKSLRSDKMVDVIFSGSSKRKALNFAQISLTFTQIKKTLTLNYEELCITRRVHRSGESEWYVNKKPVRLKDVYTLLWEAGIGKNAFYIFEQGKVDSLITSSPLERRIIFEEAAKIMHFKEKKKEALRKLSHVEENLKRVLDIQNEVNKQIETLQKQAEEARIYSENKNKLEDLEQSLLVYKWKHNQKKYDREKELSETNTTAQKEKLQEIEKLESTLKSLKEEHSSKATETRQAYEAFFEVKKAKELATFEYTTHQKQQRDLQQQKEGLKSSLQTLHQKHLKEHKTFEENQKELQVQTQEVSSLSSHLEKINSNLLTLEQTVEKETSQRKEAQQALMEVVNSENELRSQHKNISMQLHGYKESLAKLTHHEKQDFEETEEKKALQKSLTETLAQTSKNFEKDTSRIEKLKENLSSLSGSLQQLTEQEKALGQKKTENKATLDLLKSLKNEFEGYNQSSKALLQFAEDETHSLYGKVSPLTNWFQPKKGYEVQLSTILQPYLDTLVVKSNADLTLLVEVANQEGLKNFSCLSLEYISSSVKKIEIADSNLVSSHFLCRIETKGQERTYQIREDHFLDHLGVYHQVCKEEQNHFLREVELKEREEKQSTLDQDYAQVASKIEQLEKERQAQREELDQLKQKQHENELKRNKTQYSLTSCIETLKQLQEKMESSASKKKELSASISELESKQKELIRLCTQEESKRSKQEALFSKIEKQFETNFETLKEKRTLKESLQQKISTSEKASQTLRESIRVFESKSANFEDQVLEMSSAIEKKEKEHSSLTQKNQEFEEKTLLFKARLSKAEEKYKSFENALEKMEKSEKEQELGLKVLRGALDSLRAQEVEIKTKLTQIETEIHIQKEEILEKLVVEREELDSLQCDPSLSIGKAEREIKRLKKELADQPEVNLKAISECERQKSRFEFLQSQVIDLQNSQEKLVEIITQLDDTSRQKFEETFEKIREKFKENFLLLFNGGEADLTLTASQDILDAGIEITAQPPGKKMRSIQLLSGGEKCLCAIALLFALFETQSIPFCILDEIDAPLDDTNIERFTNVLKQFVKKHQFIIITHNKRTMAIANHLLGVSMQEKGVTKIIPLEFTTQTADAAASIS